MMFNVISVHSLILFSAITANNFSEEDYKLINELIVRTFIDYKCLNVHLCRELYGTYNLKYLHETNFSFLLVHSFTNENKYCGYLYLSESFSKLKYFKNFEFEIIPRIFFIARRRNFEILELYEKESKTFQDKDFVILDLSKKPVDAFKQTRHFAKLETVDVNSSESLFSSPFVPQIHINYQQRIVKVVTFHCPVFGSIQQNDGYELEDGVETRIFKEIARKLNLKWKVLIPTDGKRWGTAYSNKTISGGILKYLYTGEADIGFCSLWIELSKYPYMVLSGYWNILCLRFLVPRPQIISNRWGTIFKPLSFDLWILIFASTLISSVVCSGLRRYQHAIEPKLTYSRKTSTVSTFITIFGMLVMTKNPNKHERNNATKHLFLWWSVFALVITTLYSSSLVSHLTYPEHHSMIDTIEGLVKAGYYWGTPYEPPIKYIFNNDNPWHKKFANKFKYETASDNRVDRILSGNYSVFVKCIGNEHFMEVHDIPDSILHELRAARSCLNYFYLGFGFRKALPYFSAADRIIAILVESGITEYWLNRVFEKEYSPTTFAKVYEYKTPPEDVQLMPLTLDNLQSVFFLLLAGFVLSAFAFFGEIFNVKLLNVKLNASKVPIRRKW